MSSNEYLLIIRSLLFNKEGFLVKIIRFFKRLTFNIRQSIFWPAKSLEYHFCELLPSLFSDTKADKCLVMMRMNDKTSKLSLLYEINRKQTHKKVFTDSMWHPVRRLTCRYKTRYITINLNKKADWFYFTNSSLHFLTRNSILNYDNFGLNWICQNMP